MTIRTTAWPPGTPCWVDLAAPHVGEATAFYGELMGWTFVDTGEAYGHYHIAHSGGHAAAAIGPIMQEGQPAAWTVYLASEDTDATAELITEHGGSILAGPMDIPGSGRMLIAQDVVGGTFGVWQAAGMVGAEIANEPGSVTWTDARLTDTAAGQAFYAAVFDYVYTPMPGAPEDYCTFSIDGQIRGGMGGMLGARAGTPSHWLTWFSVPDVDQAVAVVQAAGGSVMAPVGDTPFGRMGVVIDPFGAVLGLHTAPSQTD